MYAFLHQKAMGKTVIFTTVIEKHEFDGTLPTSLEIDPQMPFLLIY